MRTLWTIVVFYHFINANDVSLCRNGTVCNHGHICRDNICMKCIKCGVLFRKGSYCEYDFNDCGSCLPGYEEISVTNFSNIVKPCKPQKLQSHKCTSDGDCLVGYYCYEKFCTVCFDCSLLNKLPPSEGCAKDFNECSHCVDGFYELPVTSNSVLKLCERKVQDSNSVPKLVLSISNLLPFFILVVFASAVINLIIRKCKVKNDSKSAGSEQPLSPSAPPLFILDIPESVTCENKDDKCSKPAFAKELKQQANMARVFKKPNALYYFAEDSADDVSDHSNDSYEEDPGPQQRSEPSEEACSPAIFNQRNAETRDCSSSSLELNENLRTERELNVSVDNIDSASACESSPEDESKILPTEGSNSSKT